MTQIDLEPEEAVTLAARWLLDDLDTFAGRAIISELRIRFGLTTDQACDAVRIAGEMRQRATARS